MRQRGLERNECGMFFDPQRVLGLNIEMLTPLFLVQSEVAVVYTSRYIEVV